MKKIVVISMLSILLVACGDKEQVDTGNDTVTLSHNFADFNLDVDYSPTEKYEASFEKDVDGIEAIIEDELNNEHLHGNEAFDRLNPILEQLKFNATTPNEQVIEEVLSAFSLDNNFIEFELDVLFSDGTQKEYRLIK